MENDQNKKVPDKESFILWLIFIVIIVWAIMTHPMLIFGLIAVVGIWYYFRYSSPKSEDIHKKEEIIEEIELDFVAGEEKTDSFYSGVSKGSPINESHSNNERSASKGSSISESHSYGPGIGEGLHP